MKSVFLFLAYLLICFIQVGCCGCCRPHKHICCHPKPVPDASVADEWGFVTVVGKVGQPGRIEIRSYKGMRLSSVLNESGGFAPNAKLSDIKITRTGKDGRKIQVAINYNDIVQDENSRSNLTLIDGDIVYVPERIL